MNQKMKSDPIYMRMRRINRRASLLLPLLVVLSLVLAACGPEPATPTPVATATTAAPAAEQPTATVGTTEEATKPAGEAGEGLLTVSVQQQATWIRNFNPFSGDFRFPTRSAIV